MTERKPKRPPGGTKATPHKCRLPGCGRGYGAPRDGSGRGLCRTCYADARRLVRLKQTTWAELETLGLADPPIRRRPARLTNVEQALLEARAARQAQNGGNDGQEGREVEGPPGPARGQDP